MLQWKHELHRRSGELWDRTLTGSPRRTRRCALAVLGTLVAAATVPAQPPAPAARVAVPTPPPDPVPTAVVQLEGGEISSNAARVLIAAHEGGFLSTREVPLQKGSNVCDVLRTSVGLPGACSQATLDLARSLNPTNTGFRKMSADELVTVPVVAVRTYDYSVKYDRRVAVEQKRKGDVEQHWKGTLKGSDDAGYADRLTLTGYELRLEVESDDRLGELVKHLQRLRLPNVVVSAAFAQPRPQAAYTSDEPGHYYQSCLAAGALPADEEGDLGALVGRAPDDCEASCVGGDCSEVILIDTTVLPHPDLNGALMGTAPAPETAGICVPANLFSEATEHGTHLAGIIGARKNGKGVAGVDPLAIIQPVTRALPDTLIGQFINDRDQSPPMPIYAFASNWRIPANTQACRAHPIAKRICELKPLWIAAAGDEGKSVSPGSDLGPMNIGDQPGVVIVTACEDCGAVTPRLMAKANRAVPGYSMVHIAAPAVDIPSTVSHGNYGAASGTSQAVALAAGVASAMRRCWPSFYDRPDRIKVRLQVTSRPFGPVNPGDPRPDDGLTAGVLDAGLALLDPAADYVWSNGTREQFKVRRWSGPGPLELRDPVSGDPLSPSVALNNVIRVRRFPGTGTRPDQWVVYSRPADSSRLGEVLRTGPGTLDNSNQVSLEMCDNSIRTLSNLDDVLLAKTGPRQCAPQ